MIFLSRKNKIKWFFKLAKWSIFLCANLLYEYYDGIGTEEEKDKSYKNFELLEEYYSNIAHPLCLPDKENYKEKLKIKKKYYF